MGRPDVTQPVDGPEFALFLRLMREHAERLVQGERPRAAVAVTARPAYDDVVPFARRVVEEFPDRVLWGTDWPHPNMKSHMPDDGALVDFIPRIAPTAELQRRLLVDNPHAPLLGGRLTMAARLGVRRHPRHDGVHGAARQQGYHLNQFCMSLMKPENRERFKADERAYLDEWPMTEAQKQAVLDRDYNAMIAAGGNIYFLAKIFATDGLSFQARRRR